MSSAVDPEAPVQQETGHPRGLYVLFGAEMWERFSYYGMRALLVLYLVKQIGYTEAKAKLVYATYTGLVYFTPLIGGFLADRFFGQRKAILIGGLVMALGHFAMAFQDLLYLALSLLIIGNGFFKPNISTMVGNLYPQGDARRDGAYTIFYMGINLGAFFAPLACGYLGENPNFGWHYGFGLAGIGMVLGLISFLAFQKDLVGGFTADREKAGTDRLMPMDWVQVIVAAAVCAGLAYGAGRAWPELQPYSKYLVPAFIVFYGAAMLFVFVQILMTKGSEAGEGWQRVSVIMIVGIFSIVFWMAFEQAGGTLTIFADKKTDRYLINTPYAGAELRLIAKAQEGKPGTVEGENRIVVSSTEKGPQIRIFDASGKEVINRVADKSDPKLTEKAKKEIEEFEGALQKAWSIKDLNPATRREVIRLALSLGKDPKAPSSDPLPANPTLSFVREKEAIPAEGKDSVVLAATDDGTEIRIFNREGKKVADRVLKKVSDKPDDPTNKEIETLESDLNQTWSVAELSPVEKHVISSLAISIGGSPGFPASFFQSINPFLIFALAPIFSIVWIKLDRTRFGLTSTAKMGVGLLFLGCGCFLMSQAERLANQDGSVGPQWLAFVYLFFTLGEICLSPIGLSLVNKLAPVKVASLMMAVWFLCTSIANYLAGTLEEELKVYHINLWVFLIATSIGPGLLLLAVTVPLKKLGHGRI